MPVIVVDRSALALKSARLVGLQTLRMEVLSTIGEEIIDLREFEHLLAATPEAAYNALVCTRFASELGRERIYQIAPDESNQHHTTSREWRGKITVSDEMNPSAARRDHGWRRSLRRGTCRAGRARRRPGRTRHGLLPCSAPVEGSPCSVPSRRSRWRMETWWCGSASLFWPILSSRAGADGAASLSATGHRR